MNVLVVLGCKPRKDGKPSDMMMSRIEAAIKEFRAHQYDKVVLTGGPNGQPIPEAEVMAAVVRTRIPKKKLLLEKRSLDTKHNAVFVWELLKNIKVKRMTVVTSDFHVLRSRYIFNRIFEHMRVKIRFVSAKTKLGAYIRTKRFFKELFAIVNLKLRGIR